MKISRINTKSIVYISIIFSFLLYWGVWNGFFQQDEWAGIANFFINGDKPFPEKLIATYQALFRVGFGHFLPLVPLVNLLKYEFFGLNYFPYAVLSIIFHSIASASVYVLAKYITEDKRLALIAFVLFLVNSSASQAVIWVGTSIPTQLAMIFSTLSLISFLKWTGEQVNKYLFFSAALLFIALAFKETAFYLFLLLPLVYIVRTNKLSWKFLVISFSTVIIYLSFRIILLSSSVGLTEALEKTGLLISNFITNYAYICLTGIVQIVLPQELIYFLIEKGASLVTIPGAPEFNSPAYDIFLFSKVTKVVISSIGGLFILAITFLIFKSTKVFRTNLLLSCLFYLTAFIPIALISTGELRAALVSPRSLYIPLIGTSILICLLLSKIKNTKIALVILLTILSMHIYNLRLQINQFNIVGMERKLILETISNGEKFPDKVLIYTESDKSFYGLPPEERILPFQSGFGQTLLVWTNSREVYPLKFLQSKNLWELTSQDYLEINNRGFGYFRNFDLLIDSIQKNNLSERNVIAYRYDSHTKKIKEITSEIRGRIRGYQIQKEPLANNLFDISVSHNKEDAELISDGDRNTSWDSKLPYRERSQYLEINLKDIYEVSQITIDVFNNKDQNNVGFVVSTSVDGTNWQEVFYSAIYPPKDNGKIDIYFEPIKSKFIRIEQIGHHEVAPWVISELAIYVSGQSTKH
jgi:hypothetical protein